MPALSKCQLLLLQLFVLLVLYQIIIDRQPSIWEQEGSASSLPLAGQSGRSGHVGLCLPWAQFTALTMDPEHFLPSPK